VTSPAPVSDGRTARSQRTRQAVVDALLALIQEGDMRPTAREIAERAGISLRSVYVHFDDLEDLFCAVAERQMASVRQLIEPIPLTDPLPERIAAMCRIRARIYEEVGPVRRAATMQPASPTLTQLLARTRTYGRDATQTVFAAELAHLSETQRQLRVAQIDAASSPEVWDLWRGPTYDLSYEAAVHAMADAVTILLSAAGPAEGGR
jgi:TetR/AcrR family transcriptional regulator, regulator of autoinduction and epiphytic fitness